MFTVVLNRLLSLIGAVLPETEWAPVDTALVLKVGVGVLAAVVGVLAVTAAAKTSAEPPRTAARGMQSSRGRRH